MSDFSDLFETMTVGAFRAVPTIFAENEEAAP